MLKIAVIEDTPDEAKRLVTFLRRFELEQGVSLECALFDKVIPFLENYRFQYDIVFMDIELPDMSGMDAARRLREQDDSVILIFVTHLSQYAVKGYEVDALDYIVKPINYPALAIKLRRAVNCTRNNSGQELMFNTNEGLIKLRASSLMYAEVYKHHIRYCTENGDHNAYGTLKQVEALLPAESFFRLGSSHIVNLQHVVKYIGDEVTVGKDVLPISRMRKKDFLEALHRYCMRTRTDRRQ